MNKYFILRAICLSLILASALSHSCYAKSLSGNEITKPETEGGKDVPKEEITTSETTEINDNVGTLKSSLEDFFKTLTDTLSLYQSLDIENGYALIHALEEINEKLQLLYDEIKKENEQVSEYILSVEESWPESSEPSEMETDTETETESETDPPEESEEGFLLDDESVSSANLNDINDSLTLILDELRKADKAAETVKSILSGIALAVTIGTGFIAGLIALRRFR